jgi:hypothetical protein
MQYRNSVVYASIDLNFLSKMKFVGLSRHSIDMSKQRPPSVGTPVTCSNSNLNAIAITFVESKTITMKM